MLKLPNQHDDFLHRLTNAWCMQALAEIYKEADPELATQYLEKIVASRVRGQALEDAKRLLAELRPG